MEKQEKIQSIADTTKEVFNDCLMQNGGLVAAPSHMPYYPSRSKNYFYCWPGRDMGFNIIGAFYLGIDAFEEALNWIWERAEGYQYDGLLLKSYYINGRIHGSAFQPDQTATLLWSIAEYSKYRELPQVAKDILEKSAQGLINVWEGDGFNKVAEGPWEEQMSYPKFGNNLTYSLAACSGALKKVSDIVSNEKVGEVAEEMKKMIDGGAYNTEGGYFVRRFGGVVPPDENIDASVLGLVWPFEIIEASDERMENTLQAVEEKLVDGKGVYRYQFDYYEGEVQGDVDYKAGAGAWPLLTSWMSIVQKKMGNDEKAEEYFETVLNQTKEDMLIPEQVFDEDDPRVGVRPLLWSHMMFVHAARELGYIN